jgi:ferredoxin-NADP reductase
MQTGIVEAVSTKDVTTKFGTKPTYSIKVNGGWVKCGFKNHNANVGDEVEFDGNTGTYGVETKAVIVLRKGSGVAPAVTSSTPAATAPAPQTKAFGGYKDKVFPIPALHGDRAIVRQNALARATDIYIAARGGKPFELEPENLDFVIKLARKFEAYTAGDIDMMEAIEEDSTNPLV